MRKDEKFVYHYILGRPGDDLLSRVLRRSTIGSGDLNDRVRNGIGWGISDKVTGSTKYIRMRRNRVFIGKVKPMGFAEKRSSRSDY